MKKTNFKSLLSLNAQIVKKLQYINKMSDKGIWDPKIHAWITGHHKTVAYLLQNYTAFKKAQKDPKYRNNPNPWQWFYDQDAQVGGTNPWNTRPDLIEHIFGNSPYNLNPYYSL